MGWPAAGPRPADGWGKGRAWNRGKVVAQAAGEGRPGRGGPSRGTGWDGGARPRRRRRRGRRGAAPESRRGRRSPPAPRWSSSGRSDAVTRHGDEVREGPIDPGTRGEGTV